MKIMKIYEKPLVDVKSFDVEDVMFESGNIVGGNVDGFTAIVGEDKGYSGVVFKW